MPAAHAKQVVTGHAEISGKHGNVAEGQGVDVFSHKNFARVRFICGNNPMESGLQVTNLENRPIRFTYSFEVNFRRSVEVKPHDSETVDDFTLTDVGITDLSHKYATLNIDWGQRESDGSCDFAVHTILHFPDGTPLNG